ncbi:carbohydrate ABC transporter permease [Paenibacillus sp. PCH8]|uniref:carbohydrate ABC transporter permease n=1 Tax=Paenibacillus TaxID=44249 RepID=UPI00093868F2|nr:MULTISPECIES: carbohydrate ABC transporter permease [Paenibacillus]APO47641.1 sugar ABC transporter permease [Paenibacillus xylanexedens]PQP81004.1 carbohydrate ABC transporter permease [Paenibacillus sp. PCH8]
MIDIKERKWSIAGHILMIILSVLAIAPFILLLMSSITDETAALRNGYSFFPEKFSLDAYKYIAGQWEVIGKAYLVSIFVTVVGTIVGVLISAMLAYTLSKPDLPGRSLLMFLLIFTMLFNGGLTATYIVYTQIFHIKDTIFGLLLPNLLMNAYFVVMFKNYFEYTLPAALVESARIDGATEFRVFRSIAIPLSMPMFVTVGMTTALTYWNDWTNGMYFLSTNSKIQSVQTILNNINENIKFLQQNNVGTAVSTADLPSVTIRMAIAIVGILPMLALFPIFQKWFVKGATAGAVKE